MHVTRRGTLQVYIGRRTVPVYRGGRLDDFDVQASGERLKVAEDEFARYSVGCREELVELSQAEGSQYGNDLCIVAEVEVQVLKYGECGCVIVECEVDSCRG